jgi:predicted AlkP superfamily pyrophosphatase or phosphodiesterase
MRIGVRAGIAALVCLLLAGGGTAQKPVRREPVTILISIDGFRADYLGRGLTPTLSRLAKDGVSGPMRPSFPTKTFPNHYALVTGLHPDRHGIVGNKFEDPAHPDQSFSMAEHKGDFWWEEAEPIWTAAEKAGIRTAPIFWPGADVANHGVRPGIWQHYDEDVSAHQRIDAAIDLLRRPESTRPRFLTLYFENVDTQGHHHGPDSPELAQALRDVDGDIAYLQTELSKIAQPANLVIVADHGMAATDPARVVMIRDIADPADFHVIEDGPYAAIAPLPGHETALAGRLLAPHAHATCYRKQDLPAHLRFGRNPRVAAFVCLAEAGWLLLDKLPAKGVDLGSHGYDNREPDMQALFIASGPAFKTRRALPVLDSVDVYPLLRDLLGLPPKSGIDGSDAPFRDCSSRVDAMSPQPISAARETRTNAVV